MNIENMQRYSEVDLFSAQGRMGRKQYFFYSTVAPFIFFWIFASVAGVIAKLGSEVYVISYFLLALAIISIGFMMIHLTIQRCHDFNASGWLAVFALVPFANLIYALIPSDNGLNSYGEAPEPASNYISTAVAVLITLFIALGSLLFFISLI